MAGQTVVVSVLADTKKFESGFKAAGGMTKGLLVGVGALAVGVGAWVGSTAKDLLRVERLGANTAAVIKATGGAAGKSAADVARYASKFEDLTGLEQETVTEGQNVLLTFKHIKGTNFDKATASAADLAVWMNKGSLEGANMAGASKLVGKALENPTKGMAALAKVGVTFTDQEKEQIATLQKKGDLAGAQALILAAVNGQVAGSALAAGNTTEGMWAKVGNSIGNVSEEILSGLLPALTGMATWFLKDGMPAVRGFGDWIAANIMPVLGQFGGYITDTLVPALVGFGGWIVANKDWLVAIGITIGVLVGAFQLWMGALALWQVATKAAAAVQVLFNLVMSANPIALVVVAIAALVAGLVYFFTQTDTGRAIWASFTAFIGSAWATVAKALAGTWAAVSGAFSAGVNAVKGFLGRVWDYIKLVWNWSPLGLIVNNWSKVMAFFGAIPGKIKGWFDGAIGWLKSAGGNLIEGLWRGISDGYTWITDKIRGWVTNVLDFIKGAFGIHSPSTKTHWMGEQLGKGLAGGLLSTRSLVDSAWSTLTGLAGVQITGSTSSRGTGGLYIAPGAIVVHAGVGDPAEIGSQIVTYIKAYTGTGGRNT